jgi:hypothetical protein
LITVNQILTIDAALVKITQLILALFFEIQSC